MKWFHFAVGFLAAACFSLQAQTIHMRASIPFSFQAGEKVMPAGDYSFRHSAGVLVVYQEDGEHAGFLSYTLSRSRLNPGTSGQLTFHRYGDLYFLEELWEPGSKDGQAVRVSTRERELASTGSRSATVAVVTK